MVKPIRVKSRAAQETARVKAERTPAASPKASPDYPVPEGLPPAETERPGGMITRMRGGFQAVAGGKAKKNRVMDVVLWIAVLAAALFFVARRL